MLRFFTKLKCRLMPYLFAAAGEAHAAGIPVMRAMLLEFPDDPGCDTLDRQYMLGDSLLVAPVFTPDGTVDYYLPAGRWTHFLTGQVVEGGRWLRERHDTLSLPLLARPNSIIAVGATDDRPDYDFADGVTFHVFEIQDGATLTCQRADAQGRDRHDRRGDALGQVGERQSEWGNSAVARAAARGARSAHGRGRRRARRCARHAADPGHRRERNHGAAVIEDDVSGACIINLLGVSLLPWNACVV